MLPLENDSTLPLGAAGDAAPFGGTLGRYIVQRALGSGGMGIVVAAHDPTLGRAVALKLLRAETGRTRARMELEAQAMARLAHPNVVTVYEVDHVDGRTFVAMELVEGSTLRRWLESERRTWREIVEMFVAAGRGLAAAHEAGLVHRDFKPDNVLLGPDGRPRVSDFGLVSQLDDAPDVSTSDPPSSTDITTRGSAVGTPAYMPPEQWRGGPIDARSDQFAFCVSLWEALWGRRPFAGATPIVVRTAVEAGEIAAPGGSRGVPRRVERILRRGLAIDPAARWPDVPTLLAALTRATRVRRRVAVVAGAALAAVATVTTTALIVRAPTCPVPTAQLAGIWDDATRARVVAHLADEPRERHLLEVLDRYSDDWLAASVAACRSPQSPALGDKRTICLERGRTALAVVTQALTTANRETIERAQAAIAQLPDLAACSDLERLDATVSPPADPVLRARLAAVRDRLDRASAQRLQGHDTEALAATRAALEEARAIGYAPVRALALKKLGDLYTDAFEDKDAEPVYREAALAAADGHDDRLAAEAWSKVLHAAAQRGTHLDAAAELDPVVDAAVRRAGNPPELRYLYLDASARLADQRNDFDVAFDRIQEAARVAPTASERAAATRGLALVIWRRDGAARALDTAARGVALTEQALGPDDLDTENALYIAAQIMNAAGRWAEARPLAERALAIRLAHHGAEATAAAGNHVLLGNIAANLHDIAVARVHFERAIAIGERDHVDDLDLAIPLGALGVVLQESDHPEDAIPVYQRSLALLAKSSGTDKLEYLGISSNLAATYERLGRCGDARAIVDRVEPGLKALPHLYPELLLTVARCARPTQPDAAIATLEHAAELCRTHACDPRVTIAIDWELGTTLFESKRDLARGATLAHQAHDALVAADPKDPLVAKRAAWLAGHTH